MIVEGDNIVQHVKDVLFSGGGMEEPFAELVNDVIKFNVKSKDAAAQDIPEED